MDINNIVKPFYIYTSNDDLYIKNINEETYKLESNVKSYSAAIDDNEAIHLCCINNLGKLFYIYNKNNVWRKRFICNVSNYISNITNMKLYMVNKSLNIFILENDSIYDELYNMLHVCTETVGTKSYKHTIHNILKDKESIYKINIDDNNDIIFEYKILEGRSNNRKVKIFKTQSKKWINENEQEVVSIKSSKPRRNRTKKSIKQEINDYSNSINYCDK